MATRLAPIDRIRELHEAGLSRQKIADRLDVSLATVYKYVPADKPLAGKGVSSMKDAILVILTEHPGLDSTDLVRRIGAIDNGRWKGVALHSLQHVLHSMVKQGQLTGRVVSNGKARTLVNLRVPQPEGQKPYHAAMAPEATSQPPEQEVVASAPEREAIRFPLLAAIRTRREASAKGRADAARLIEAAAILEDVWPEKSQELEQRANERAADGALSSVEAEYLAFADWVDIRYRMEYVVSPKEGER